MAQRRRRRRDRRGHQRDLAEPALALTQDHPASPAELAVALPLAPAQRAETGLAVRTREPYAIIQDLLRRGLSRTRISRQLRLDPQTVRRFADATSLDDLLVNTGRRDSIIYA